MRSKGNSHVHGIFRRFARGAADALKTAPSLFVRYLGVFAFLVLAFPAYASTAYSTLALTDSAGEPVLVVHDELAGVLTIAKGWNQSDLEFIYVPVRRYGFTEGHLIRAGDFNGDGLLDLVLPAYATNRVLVLWGADLEGPNVPVDLFSPGPGPAFVAPARIGRAPAEAVLAASTARANVQVRGWDAVARTPVTTAADYPEGFGQDGIFGFETAAYSRGGSDPVLGILRRDAGAEFVVLKIVHRAPPPEYGPDNEITSWNSAGDHTRLISGHPAGENEAGWFLAYAPGASLLEFFPSNPGDSLVADLGSPVAQVWFLPEVDDEVLVLFQNGQLAQYDFSPETGLTLAQAFSPPPGMGFAGAAGGNGTLMALLSDVSGALTRFQVFTKGPQGYELTNEGDWPVLPVTEGVVTVVLYTGDPFAMPAPFAFETFAAGEWTSDAAFDQGTVSAWVETFGGSAQGLGNPLLQLFQPAADPGPGGAARGNQWEPSSSLHYLAPAATADGIAAVAILPSPGSYPNTIAVTFQAGEDVSVQYRVNNGPWQSGLGPFLVTQDATVEYYGEHISGALSSIHTAVYKISQSLVVDTDGDGVPDIIEDLAGTNPFDPDSGGNGFGDFNWILYGDPQDPNAAPAHAALPFDHVKVEVLWDGDGAALPAAGQKLFVGNLSNHHLGTAEGSPSSPRKYDNITLKRGLTENNAVAKFWFPASYLVEGNSPDEPVGPAMTALGGVPSAPLPSISLDLDAEDPLEAWRQAALAAVEEHENTVVEFTIGPSSTMAALVFEYWYGTRLVELGRLPALDDRPRLADTPRSVRSGIAMLADVEAIETPQGEELPAHELAHVVQQVNEAVGVDPSFLALRETAEAFYGQAINAARDGTPLDPPIEALRRALTGSVPAGYVLPHEPAVLESQRDQILNAVASRGLVVLIGTLSRSGDELILHSEGRLYLLRDRRGRPYRLAGSGLVVDGSLARVTGAVLPSNDVAIEELIIAVERIEVESVPATADTDLNGNSLPDSWELFFLGTLKHGVWDDLNGDGFSLGEAYLAGLDPRDPFSSPPGAPAVPRNLRLSLDAPNGPRVEWDGAFVAEYELWQSRDMVQWTPHPGKIDREGDREHSVDVELDDPRGFYQLLIRLPIP